MQPSKKQSRTTQGIYKRILPSGQISWLVSLGRDANGKQRWKRFNDKNEAIAHRETLEIAKANEGQLIWSLSPEQRSEAVKSYKLLEPFQANLFDAAQYYVEHVLHFRNSPSIEDLVKQLVERMEKNGRRFRSVKDVRTRLEKFSENFKGRRLSEVTLEELKNWFDKLALSSRSISHYMTKVSQLYNYAIRHNWCAENLVNRLDRPSIEESDVGIFSPDEALRLLQHADAAEIELLPYIAIAFFAGLRSAELQQIEWSAVKISERAIIVGAAVAKKRGQRVVDITDTLAAWLAPHIKTTGTVTPHGYRLRPRLLKLAKEAKVIWKRNGLRHSFCSYHLAAFGDPIKTAYQAGNSADMIHRHYKALVTTADAERFWNLRPTSAVNHTVTPKAI